MHLVQLQNPAADGALTELVSTLASAGSSLKNLKFDLVILDKNLPDGSGIDFIKTIKSVNQVLPVVILTSDSELNSINEALELGAEDYLIKTPDIIANLLIKVPFLIRQNARKKELEFNNLGLPKSEINLSSKNYESFLKYAERSYIQRAIKICGGNATRASNSLGISKATIYRKLTEWESLQKDNA